MNCLKLAVLMIVMSSFAVSASETGTDEQNPRGVGVIIEREKQ